MRFGKWIVGLTAVATVGLSASAFGASQDSYTGKLDHQPSSYMGADVFLNGKDVPKTINIGFSLATASCNGQAVYNGQVGNVRGAKLKKQGKKFTFKGTGVQGPGESTMNGTLSANGKKITGSVDYETPLGNVTCTFSDSFTLKKDKGPKDDGNEND